jgi:hypothetical protein
LRLAGTFSFSDLAGQHVRLWCSACCSLVNMG